jgi:hypothetical protein
MVKGEETEFEGDGVMTYVVFLYGTYVICRFALSELALARKKSADCKNLSFTLHEMLQYRLDFYFSTSKWAKAVLLLSATFVLIVVGAGMLTAVTGGSVSHTTWKSWTYVADPGTHADAEGVERFVSIGITIGGMLVFALMIGIISDAIGAKVDDLKKGNSRVIESNHTLMLGWSDKSLAIIEQIALANESECGGSIVVLAFEEKEDMEMQLRHATERVEQPLRLLGTAVVFRNGNPLAEQELHKVSVLTARSIIVLSPFGNANESDSTMLRQVLALKSVTGIKAHIVVEMQDIDNRGLVELVHKDQVEVIVAHDIIGRLMIMCARSPGLAFVKEALLGFDGSEFYFESWPKIVGETFLQITCRFDDAVPVGVKSSDGKIKINPENSYVIKKDDQILCLAEDNDSYSVNAGSYNINNEGEVASLLIPNRGTERLLFCGWRRDMADMIMQLDEFVAKGSELWLFNVVPAKERMKLLKDEDNKAELDTKNLTIKHVVGNPIVRRHLQVLKAVDNSGLQTGDWITLDEFDSILILADYDAVDMESADSRSLASTLIIQDIQNNILASKENGLKDVHVSALINEGDGTKNKVEPKVEPKVLAIPISEILDTRTRSLLKVANCKGYVMSNHIVSKLLAQVAENRDMNLVLGELLSAEGCEMYCRDISFYINMKKKKSRTMSFWDLARRARQRKEIVVGYKPCGMSWPEAADLILNPPKKAEARTWGHGDVLIIIAYD